jgi:hypothetical protein
MRQGSLLVINQGNEPCKMSVGGKSKTMRQTGSALYGKGDVSSVGVLGEDEANIAFSAIARPTCHHNHKVFLKHTISTYGSLFFPQGFAAQTKQRFQEALANIGVNKQQITTMRQGQRRSSSTKQKGRSVTKAYRIDLQKWNFARGTYE